MSQNYERTPLFCNVPTGANAIKSQIIILSNSQKNNIYPLFTWIASSVDSLATKLKIVFLKLWTHFAFKKHHIRNTWIIPVHFVHRCSNICLVYLQSFSPIQFIMLFLRFFFWKYPLTMENVKKASSKNSKDGNFIWYTEKWHKSWKYIPFHFFWGQIHLLHHVTGDLHFIKHPT